MVCKCMGQKQSGLFYTYKNLDFSIFWHQDWPLGGIRRFVIVNIIKPQSATFKNAHCGRKCLSNSSQAPCSPRHCFLFQPHQWRGNYLGCHWFNSKWVLWRLKETSKLLHFSNLAYVFPFHKSELGHRASPLRAPRHILNSFSLTPPWIILHFRLVLLA